MAERSGEGFSETFTINGHEILVTENNASLQSYKKEPRYDHLRINLDGSTMFMFFTERRDFLKRAGQLALSISRRPEDHIRENYWEIRPADMEMTEDDLYERRRVMSARANREADAILEAIQDMDAGLAYLAG